jgi:hypothetical protein
MSRSASTRVPGALRPAAACALLAALVAAAPAQAGPDVLKRSVGNIVFAPIDMVLSPFIAANTMYNNLRNVDDSLGVRIAYVPMGFCWNTGVQAMGAVTREITGLLELVPGIGLFFLDADMDPLLAPVDRGNALLSVDSEIFPVRVGIDYTTVPF